MENKHLEVPIDSPEKQFFAAIAPDWNKYIVFSSAFGTGKTTFLKEIFRKREADYKMIRISPIRYHVSADKDIINLIKYDLLWEILKTEPNGAKDLLETIEPSPTAYSILTKLLSEKPQLLPIAFATAFLTMWQETAIVAAEIPSILNPLYEAYRDKKTLVTDELEQKQLSEFVNLVEKDSVLQIGIADQIIHRWAVRVKSEKKKPVIVIDDIDRLYPKEIFRILNTISAAIDTRPDEGFLHDFSKIILVCDLDNIRAVYAHQFGIHADFQGYIDKLVSHEPFRFDNRSAIKTWLNAALKKAYEPESIMIEFLEKVINFYVSHDHLRLRSLVNIREEEIQLVLNELRKRVLKRDNLFLDAYVILRYLFKDEQIMLDKTKLVMDFHHAHIPAYTPIKFTDKEFAHFLIPMLFRNWAHLTMHQRDELQTLSYPNPTNGNMFMKVNFTLKYYNSQEFVEIKDNQLTSYPILAFYEAMKSANLLLA